MGLPQFYETTVIKVGRLNENTLLLELDVHGSFEFKAGQFVLTYVNVDGKEENRAFSIASSPSKDTINLLIRKYDRGKVSPKLFELKEGDKLKIRGPFGVFNVKEPLPSEIVFVAGGSGIAPLRSMMHDVLEKYLDKKVTLVFGFRYEHDFFFREEIEKLVKEKQNFKSYLCSTRPSENWEYFKGRVTEVLPKIIDSNKDKHFYICGPNQMINDTLNLLIKDMGFDRDRVIIERWGVK
ncbi:MAG: FAD-dependent oxidoreductase [Nanoarchaeota archaeon]